MFSAYPLQKRPISSINHQKRVFLDVLISSFMPHDYHEDAREVQLLCDLKYFEMPWHLEVFHVCHSLCNMAYMRTVMVKQNLVLDFVL